MTDNTALALLRDAEAYLSALHGSVARHDHLAANLGCAGCELRDKIREQLAVVPVVSPPPASRAALRDRIAAAVDEGFRLYAELEDTNLGDSITDSVLTAVLPPVDRAAILREAADELGRMDYDTDSNDYGYDTYRDAWNGGVMDGAGLLRRMAAEAQPTGQHQPRRDDAFEAWLKAQRDDHNSHGTNDHEMYDAIDALLDQYQLHADTGTPLGEHVCEGRAVGDCEHLEPAAGAEQGGEA